MIRDYFDRCTPARALATLALCGVAAASGTILAIFALAANLDATVTETAALFAGAIACVLVAVGGGLILGGDRR